MTIKSLKPVFDYVDQKISEQTEQLRSEFSHLPTKDEFYTKMDEVMGELKAIREQTKLLPHQISRNSDRISDLEKIHPSNKHSYN